MANRAIIYETVAFIYLMLDVSLVSYMQNIKCISVHRELAVPPNPPIYPLIDINDDILSKSLSYFSGYVKCMFTSFYILSAIYITVMYVKIQTILYFCHMIP